MTVICCPTEVFLSNNDNCDCNFYLFTSGGCCLKPKSLFLDLQSFTLNKVVQMFCGASVCPGGHNIFGRLPAGTLLVM